LETTQKIFAQLHGIHALLRVPVFSRTSLSSAAEISGINIVLLPLLLLLLLLKGRFYMTEKNSQRNRQGSCSEADQNCTAILYGCLECTRAV
jgi:hypothetical protein